MLYPRPTKYRAWWDTSLCRSWYLTSYLMKLWGRTFAPIQHSIPDNDRDHIKW